MALAGVTIFCTGAWILHTPFYLKIKNSNQEYGVQTKLVLRFELDPKIHYNKLTKTCIALQN